MKQERYPELWCSVPPTLGTLVVSCQTTMWRDQRSWRIRSEFLVEASGDNQAARAVAVVKLTMIGCGRQRCLCKIRLIDH